MKRFLSIYGGILFFWISYCLLLEFAADELDSSLYAYNGKSIILESFKNVDIYNLSPFTTFCFYLLALIVILLSTKFKKFFCGITIGNIIISIPIFTVHKDTLFFRPFYYSHGNVSFANIANLVWYIYFSILGVIMLLIYLFFQSERFTAKQKNVMKKAIKITLISLAVIFCINVIESIYVSFKVDSLIKDSCNSYGEVNTHPERISDRDFRCMNYLESSDYDGRHSFPITFAFFNHAQSRYWYERTSDHGTARSSFYFPEIVSLELKDFKWVITYVRSLP